MFNPNTPFHREYSIMTCTCNQCLEEKNALTQPLPRVIQRRNKAPLVPQQNDTPVMYELIPAWDTETGRQFTYCLPVR